MIVLFLLLTLAPHSHARSRSWFSKWRTSPATPLDFFYDGSTEHGTLGWWEQKPFNRTLDPKLKTILFWTGEYTYGKPVIPLNFNFSSCEHWRLGPESTQCQPSWDNTTAGLSRAHAVVFHDWFARYGVLPPSREALGIHPNQYWLWFTMEPPGTRVADELLERLTFFSNVNSSRAPNSVFNLTGWYMRGADIPMTYGDFYAREVAGSVTDWLSATHKQYTQKLAAIRQTGHAVLWCAKHCPTHSRREEYVGELARHINVTNCAGPRDLIKLHQPPACASVAFISNASSVPYRQDEHDVFERHMFYLAFEHIFCKDYLTEKVWQQALMRNLIPVVRGGIGQDDYTHALPPGSFIDARDFPSPAALAAHLHHVACNFTLYASYHAWRRTHRLLLDDPGWMLNTLEMQKVMVCKLCKFLNTHDPRLNRRTADLDALIRLSQCQERGEPLSFPPLGRSSSAMDRSSSPAAGDSLPLGHCFNAPPPRPPPPWFPSAPAPIASAGFAFFSWLKGTKRAASAPAPASPPPATDSNDSFVPFLEDVDLNGLGRTESQVLQQELAQVEAERARQRAERAKEAEEASRGVERAKEVEGTHGRSPYAMLYMLAGLLLFIPAAIMAVCYWQLRNRHRRQPMAGCAGQAHAPAHALTAHAHAGHVQHAHHRSSGWRAGGVSLRSVDSDGG